MIQNVCIFLCKCAFLRYNDYSTIFSYRLMKEQACVNVNKESDVPASFSSAIY